MKRTKIFVALLAILFLSPASSWAQTGEDYNVEFEGRYWKPKLDSTIKMVENSIGTEVEAIDDLGFDEKEDFGEGRLQIKFFKRHKFNFSYLPLKWDGDRVLNRTIQFNGQTFNAGVRVQSELDLKLFKGGYEYDFIVGDHGFLGGAIDVMVADTHVQLKAPISAIDQTEDVTLPLPMVGLIGRVYPIKWVNLTAKVSGLPLGGYGHIIDAEASININPIKYVGISAGYRYLDFKAERKDDSVDYRLDGPFLTLNVRF